VLHVADHAQHRWRAPSFFGVAGTATAPLAPHGLGRAEQEKRRPRSLLAQSHDLLAEQSLIGDGIQQIVETLVGPVGEYDQSWFRWVTQHRKARLQPPQRVADHAQALQPDVSTDEA